MPAMKLKLLAKTKSSRKGSSPSLFQDDDGRYYIQGFMVDRKVGEAAATPSGESVVEVDISLLEEIKKILP